MKILCLSSNNTNFKNTNLHPIDLGYKKAIQSGLKENFQINCKIEDLNSIAGPIELKEIIKKLKPEQYVAKDNFRANFHIHTNASDGHFTSEEFLEQCTSWANLMQTKIDSPDGLPPFSAAITDHNAITNVQKTIALIAQNPNEYKNFKFVTGCEFKFKGYQQSEKIFEAVGLGFNPFDKKLDSMFGGLGSINNINNTKNILASGGILSFAHPIYTPDKLNEEFFKFLKFYGINGVEGNYQYVEWNKNYINICKKVLDTLIKKFDMFVTGGTDSHRKNIFRRR